MEKDDSVVEHETMTFHDIFGYIARKSEKDGSRIIGASLTDALIPPCRLEDLQL
jgi:hypothetical protein